MGADRDIVWLSIGVIVLVAATLLIGLRRSSGLRRLRWRWRLSRTIRRQARAVRRGLDLPDGLDGRVWLDYVLLTSGGIVLLELRLYPGVVFAAQGVEQWAQITAGRSYHFPNPIRELERKIDAVRLRVGEGVPVRGFLVFSDETEFPKGRPDCVVHLDDLARALEALSGQAPAGSLDSAWRSILDGAAQSLPVEGSQDAR